MKSTTGNFQHIAYAFKTDIGKRRKNNEDALGAFPEAGLFCVADGMGGGDDGEIASAAVVKAVSDVAERCSKGPGHSAKDVAKALEAGLSDASGWIWRRAGERRMKMCGSTFVGVVFDSTSPAKAIAVHAGDSRVYLLRGETIKQITRDHSPAEMMGEKDESKMNPMFRNMIVNAVGIHSRVECERTPFKVAQGDRLIICSDGLYRMVKNDRMLEISRENADVDKAVEALIEAALRAGGVDNVSVVMCEIGELPKGLSAEPVPEKPVTKVDSDGDTQDSSPTIGEGETRETIMPEMSIGEAIVPDSAPAQPVAPAAPQPPKPAPQRSRTRRLLFYALAVLAAVMSVIAIALFASDAKPKQDCTVRIASQEMAKPKFAQEQSARQPESMEKPESAENPESTENQENQENPEIPEISDNPDNSETPKTPENPDNQETPKTPDIPEIPEIPETSENSAPVAQPPAAQAHMPSEAFVDACNARTVQDFIIVLRSDFGTAPSHEFNEMLGTFRESAKMCARVRSEKCAVIALTDLKFVLSAADATEQRIASLESDAAKKCREDWELVISGEESDIAVQEAGARILRGIREL